jgi:hypothetical protein
MAVHLPAQSLNGVLVCLEASPTDPAAALVASIRTALSASGYYAPGSSPFCRYRVIVTSNAETSILLLGREAHLPLYLAQWRVTLDAHAPHSSDALVNDILADLHAYETATQQQRIASIGAVASPFQDADTEAGWVMWDEVRDGATVGNWHVQKARELHATREGCVLSADGRARDALAGLAPYTSSGSSRGDTRMVTQSDGATLLEVRQGTAFTREMYCRPADPARPLHGMPRTVRP